MVDVDWTVEGLECDLASNLMAQQGASVPVPGFGSSDCRRCSAHLVALPNETKFTLKVRPHATVQRV